MCILGLAEDANEDYVIWSSGTDHRLIISQTHCDQRVATHMHTMPSELSMITDPIEYV